MKLANIAKQPLKSQPKFKKTLVWQPQELGKHGNHWYSKDIKAQPYKMPGTGIDYDAHILRNKSKS